jgi:hypothetical protein
MLPQFETLLKHETDPLIRTTLTTAIGVIQAGDNNAPEAVQRAIDSVSTKKYQIDQLKLNKTESAEARKAGYKLAYLNGLENKVTHSNSNILANEQKVTQLKIQLGDKVLLQGEARKSVEADLTNTQNQLIADRAVLATNKAELDNVRTHIGKELGMPTAPAPATTGAPGLSPSAADVVKRVNEARGGGEKGRTAPVKNPASPASPTPPVKGSGPVPLSGRTDASTEQGGPGWYQPLAPIAQPSSQEAAARLVQLKKRKAEIVTENNSNPSSVERLFKERQEVSRKIKELEKIK